MYSRRMARDRRVLPHNLDAEASILGGILLRNEVLLQLESLEVEDFYHFQHKVVFEAVRNLEASISFRAACLSETIAA